VILEDFMQGMAPEVILVPKLIGKKTLLLWCRRKGAPHFLDSITRRSGRLLDTDLSALADLGLPYKDKALMSDGAFVLQPESERGRIFFIGHVALWRRGKQGDATRGVIVGFADDKPDQAVWCAFPASESADNILLDNLRPKWAYLRDLLPEYASTATGQSVSKTKLTRQQLLELASLLVPEGRRLPDSPPLVSIVLPGDSGAGRALRSRAPKACLPFLPPCAVVITLPPLGFSYARVDS
jgi:hypothetical protein